MQEARLGSRTRGVWSRRAALTALTPGQVDARMRCGVWQSPWAGVYADAGHALDAEQRAVAAVLASRPAKGRGAAAACGRTAARLHGLPLVDDDDPATGRHEVVHDHVAAPRSLPDLHRDGRVLHRHQLVLRDGDVVRTSYGLAVTSVARTLADCAALLRPDALVCAVDAALHDRLVTAAELATRPALRKALAVADGRAESPAETLARLLLLPAVPALRPQVALHDGWGRVLARFDLADERVRLAVEADGRRGHAGELMVARDRQRDATARAQGWHTERVTWFELRRRGADVRARVVAAHTRLSTRSA